MTTPSYSALMTEARAAEGQGDDVHAAAANLLHAQLSTHQQPLSRLSGDYQAMRLKRTTLLVSVVRWS